MAAKTGCDGNETLAKAGAGVPDDLGRLADYLRTLAWLMREQAVENPPTWEEACEAGEALLCMQGLEAAALERAAALPADDAAALVVKFAILRAAGLDAAEPLRDALLDSIEADLRRIAGPR